MSDIESGQVPAVADENGNADTVTAETQEIAPGAQSGGNSGNPDDGDSFPREVVEKLRKENADWRTRSKTAEDQADKLARRLHRAIVEATNRLENADDLAFDAEHLDDADKLGAALDALLSDRPYMAKRTVKGDVGQGDRGDGGNGVNLLEMLKGTR